jgi:Phasin protein
MQNPTFELYQAQLEALRNLASVIFSNTEKMNALALTAAKSGIGDQLKYAQALSAARDADGLKTLQSTFTNRAPDAILSFYRDAFKLFVDGDTEVGKVAESYLEDMKAVALKTGNSATRNISIASANGSADTVTPTANFINLWSKSYQQFADLTKQYMHTSEMTEMPIAATAKRQREAKSRANHH